MDTITGDTMAAAAANLSGGGESATGTTPSSASSAGGDGSSLATAAPASPAGDSSTADAMTSPATTAQVPGSDVTGSDEPTGPIPLARHKAVLEKTRTEHQQALQQAQQQIHAQVREHYAPTIDLQERFQRDPIGTYIELGREMEAHPEFGPQLKSQAARWLRGAGVPKPAAAAVPETPMPTPDIFDPATGEQFYSPQQAQKLMEWKEQRLIGEVETRMAPLQQHVEQQQRVAQEQERAAKVQQAWDGALNRAAVTLGHWRKMPGFTEHEPQIKQLVKQGHDLGLAYARVVVPKLSQAQQSRVIADLNQKATAGTVNPGQASIATQGPPSDMREAVARAAQQYGLR